MHDGKITKLTVPAVNAFNFQIKLTETDRSTHTYEIGLHTHEEFELYINLSGDISFLVEKNLYELTRGDVIIARPGEHHHCVYRSDAPHRHFWILFDCRNNGHIFDFLQAGFHQNYISPREDLREELLDLCFVLHGGSLTEEEKVYTLFRIFAILKKSIKAAPAQGSKMPQELQKMIDYINSHIYEEITVTDVAKAFYISQSTLARRFKESLALMPLEYIRRKKLLLAAEMLREGKTVFAAGSNVGYHDNSYFIELFKKYYGVTPHQYKQKWGRHGPADSALE